MGVAGSPWPGRGGRGHLGAGLHLPCRQAVSSAISQFQLHLAMVTGRVFHRECHAELHAEGTSGIRFLRAGRLMYLGTSGK